MSLQRSRDEIYASLNANVASRMGVTDLRVGGNAVQICAVMADELYAAQRGLLEVRDAGMANSATGADLDAIMADVLPAGLARTPATLASGGALTFTRSAEEMAAYGAATVFAGSPVAKSVDNTRYVSAADATFGALALVSSAVTVVCQRAGEVGNAAVGEINTLATNIAGVSGCTNTSSITNGTDEDDDETAREMMRLHVAAIAGSTQAALVNAALKVEATGYGRVRNARFYYDATKPGTGYLYIDDGNGTAGEITAVVAEVLIAAAEGGEIIFYTEHRPMRPTSAVTTRAGAPTPATYVPAWGQVRLGSVAVAAEAFAISYSYYNGLCEAVQDAINGDLEHILTTPDVAGAGCEVLVAPAAKYGGTSLPIQAVLQLASGVSPDDVSDDIKRAITAYVNSLDIGQALYPSDIVVIARSFSQIVNVAEVLLNGAEAPIVPLYNQVVRTADSAVTLL